MRQSHRLNRAHRAAFAAATLLEVTRYKVAPQGAVDDERDTLGRGALEPLAGFLQETSPELPAEG